MRGLLGAALTLALSCGPSKDDAVRIKEGQNLDDIATCPGLLCAGPNEFCAELLYEYGVSPPLCVDDHICDRFDCVKENKRCVLFDGIPVQMRCINDK
jgi:hypothetical protein